jgi:lipopolysaccharide/colanic/teichoic acid biosynthesis glycosyltransferase
MKREAFYKQKAGITGLKQILGTKEAEDSLKTLLANRKIAPRFSQNANKFIKLKQNCPW